MHRRRKNRGGGIVLVMLFLALIAFVLLKFVFVVRNVEIEGIYSAGYEEIIRASKVQFGASMLKVDAEEMRQSLESGGLYALEDVRRQFPNTLVLEIRERERAAMMLHAGKIVVMDAEGYVIEAVPQAPDMDLVYISGADAGAYRLGEKMPMSQARQEAYAAVMQAIWANGAQIYVSELKLDDTDMLRIITRTGINVELGGRENMVQKIAWMKSAVADLEMRGERGGTLDVTSGTKADYKRSEAQSD